MSTIIHFILFFLIGLKYVYYTHCSSTENSSFECDDLSLVLYRNNNTTSL